MADYTKPSKVKKSEPNASPERVKKEKVVSDKAIVKRENGFSKLAHVFLAEDISNIKDVLVWDIVVPAIRDTLFKMIGNGAHMMLYGTPQAEKRDYRKPTVSYASMYQREEKSNVPVSTPQVSTSGVPKSVTLPSQKDAEDLMAEIFGTIEDYGRMSILDLKEFIGDEAHIRSTDDKYGWMSHENFYYKKHFGSDQYEFYFPRPLPFE